MNKIGMVGDYSTGTALDPGTHKQAKDKWSILKVTNKTAYVAKQQRVKDKYEDKKDP